MKPNLWTREELILALNLYWKLPFGKMHGRNPEVQHLAKIIGRTGAAIAMRLANYAHLDDFHKARKVNGLAHGKRQVEPIWNEFLNNQEELIFESERILAEKEHLKLEMKYRHILENMPPMVGEDKIREVKTRVNQAYFRQIVLVNYSSSCAISRINAPDLLVASHIIPWSKNKEERLNPENGFCLSAIHDKAFDKGLITVDTDYRMLISKHLKEYQKTPFYEFYFGQFEGKPIGKAEKYFPRKEFLEFHLSHIFQK